MPMRVFNFAEHHAINIESDNIFIPVNSPNVIIVLKSVRKIVFLNFAKVLFDIALVRRRSENVNVAAQIVIAAFNSRAVFANINFCPPFASFVCQPKSRNPRRIHQFCFNFKIAVKFCSFCSYVSRCMCVSIEQFLIAVLIDFKNQFAVFKRDVICVKLCWFSTFPNGIFWVPFYVV